MGSVIRVSWVKGSKDGTHNLDRDELRNLHSAYPGLPGSRRYPAHSPLYGVIASQAGGCQGDVTRGVHRSTAAGGERLSAPSRPAKVIPVDSAVTPCRVAAVHRPAGIVSAQSW
jgi:hypothetical protein